MIMVRDPDTGEVLSFARGGRAEVRTGKRNLDLLVSDGVRSRPAKVRMGERDRGSPTADLCASSGPTLASPPIRKHSGKVLELPTLLPEDS